MSVRLSGSAATPRRAGARNGSGRLFDLPETHGLRVPLFVQSNYSWQFGGFEFVLIDSGADVL
jgi:hypothetical protein